MPIAKAVAPSNPCNSQFDFGLPTSASFKARSVKKSVKGSVKGFLQDSRKFSISFSLIQEFPRNGLHLRLGFQRGNRRITCGNSRLEVFCAESAPVVEVTGKSSHDLVPHGSRERLENVISGRSKRKSPEIKGLFSFKMVEAAGIEPASENLPAEHLYRSPCYGVPPFINPVCKKA
jgi:hypothetical protein